MSSIHTKVSILCLVIFFAVNTVNAETRVEKDDLEKLVTGKTLEGKWIMWESNYRMYLHPDGSFKRIYGKGETFDVRDSGSWWVSKNGKLCYKINKKACRRVKQRDDEGYNLYNKQMKLKQTIEKITDGNPYKL